MCGARFVCCHELGASELAEGTQASVSMSISNALARKLSRNSFHCQGWPSGSPIVVCALVAISVLADHKAARCCCELLLRAVARSLASWQLSIKLRIISLLLLLPKLTSRPQPSNSTFWRDHLLALVVAIALASISAAAAATICCLRSSWRYVTSQSRAMSRNNNADKSLCRFLTI